METIKIINFADDWYKFGMIPQEHRYIKIDCLRQSSQKKAINTAKKINSNFIYEVEKVAELTEARK